MATRILDGAAVPSATAAIWRPATAAHTHYYALDFLRGAAALAVVLRHYPRFLMTRLDHVPSPAAVIARMPFADTLGLFYTAGQWSVQFFWMLSGFVFAAVYAGQRPAAGRFAVARLARLYPLLLVTTAVVVVLDAACVARFGRSVFTASNDWPHLLMNLALVSGWGFDNTMSFNFPFWSVSLEILIYMVFLAVLPWLFRHGLAGPLLLALAFRVAMLASAHNVFLCGFLFFTGSAIFCLHRSSAARTQFVAGLAVLAASVAWLTGTPDRGMTMAISAGFAGLILATAAAEPWLAPQLRRMHWFGDTSYGIYLWHVPLQLLVILLVADRGVLLSPWALAAFLAVTVAVARLSFLVVEAPARRWINARAAGRGRAANSGDV